VERLLGISQGVVSILIQRKSTSTAALIALVISLAGLSLLPILLTAPPPTIIIPWQTQLIGGLFMLICIFGIAAGISPRHCSFSFLTRTKSKKVEPPGKHSPPASEIQKRGHHPTCEAYARHVLKLQSRTLCAGCSGLVTGACFAILGAVLFFFLGWRFFDPYLIFWIGFGLVVFGLIQHLIYQILRISYGTARFIVNILFVLGPFLLLASLMQILNNLTLAGYLLLLTLYWIFTRITMSKRSHRLICGRCPEHACALREV
jgi:hypothetical protein